MSHGRDETHLLRVDEQGEHEIIHPAGCPTERREADAPFGGYDEYVCGVGQELSYWGTDFLTDGEGNDVTPANLAPGDYGLVFEWSTPSSSFEDPEINLWVELPALRATRPELSEEPAPPPVAVEVGAGEPGPDF